MMIRKAAKSQRNLFQKSPVSFDQSLVPGGQTCMRLIHFLERVSPRSDRHAWRVHSPGWLVLSRGVGGGAPIWTWVRGRRGGEGGTPSERVSGRRIWWLVALCSASCYAPRAPPDHKRGYFAPVRSAQQPPRFLLY